MELPSRPRGEILLPRRARPMKSDASTGCVERSFLAMLAVDSRMHFASEPRSLAAGNSRTRSAMSFITRQEN
jgi:hypothetical protein